MSESSRPVAPNEQGVSLSSSETIAVKADKQGKAGHHRIGVNVFSNWLSYASGLIIAFLLSPFLVHHLGDVGYGIWSLALQVGAYLGLLDLGIRIAVTRYLTLHHTRGERHDVNAVVSVGVVSLGTLAIVCTLISLVLAYRVPHWAHIPSLAATDAQWTVLLVGLSVAVTFPGAMFSGALAALSRYDILNIRTIATMILQALLFWYALAKGHGVLALAVIFLVIKGVGYLFEFWQAWRLYDGFEFGLYRDQFWGTMKTLFSFSIFAFLLSISARLILWSDNLVVGFVLGPAAVTYYAIGGNLVDNGRSVMGSITSVFVPLATSYEATGAKEKLRKLLVQGSRGTLIVILPIAIALIIVGSSFIGLWMGQKYVVESSAVLLLLAIPLLFNPLQATCNQILYAINKHKYYSFIVLFEAGLNLVLSIVLAKRVGLLGVAWGTLIPELLVGATLVPIYTARNLGASVWGYFWNGFGRVAFAALPYPVALYACRRWGWTSTWLGFIGSVAISLVVYGASMWMFGLTSDERSSLVRRAKSLGQRIGVVPETRVAHV